MESQDRGGGPGNGREEIENQVTFLFLAGFYQPEESGEHWPVDDTLHYITLCLTHHTALHYYVRYVIGLNALAVTELAESQ